MDGWRSICFDGDSQPFGYVDPVSRCELAPVSGPEYGSGAAAQLALDPAGVWRIVGGVLATPDVGRDQRVARTAAPRGPGAPGRAPRPASPPGVAGAARPPR